MTAGARIKAESLPTKIHFFVKNICNTSHFPPPRMIQRAHMSSLSHSRIVAAIRGAFVADAASMGTHWIYDPVQMLQAVPSPEAPEFKDPPNPSFYSSSEFKGHYGSGMLSPYGEQLLFVTEFSAAMLSIDGSKMSDAMLEWANTFGGRPDHATTEFVKNMKEGKIYPECGADDDQGKFIRFQSFLFAYTASYN